MHSAALALDLCLYLYRVFTLIHIVRLDRVLSILMAGWMACFQTDSQLEAQFESPPCECLVVSDG